MIFKTSEYQEKCDAHKQLINKLHKQVDQHTENLSSIKGTIKDAK